MKSLPFIQLTNRKEKIMYNSELMKAIDEVYERMPYKWEKWEKWGKPAVDTEKDLVELLEDCHIGYYPFYETQGQG